MIIQEGLENRNNERRDKTMPEIKSVCFVCLLIIALTYPSYSAFPIIPKDTTSTAGRGARIAGYCLLGFAIAYVGMGAYGYYDSKQPQYGCVRNIFYDYPVLLAGGIACGIASGIFLKIGYDRKHVYEKWRKETTGTLSVTLSFNLSHNPFLK
jgi:hypothetical protein